MRHRSCSNRPMRRRLQLLAIATVLGLQCRGGRGDGQGDAAGSVDGGSRTVVLPPEGAPFDYQIGGDYPPPAGVRVVSRDRGGEPAPGLYSICYVNGFQTQPGEGDFWLTGHPDLVLRDSGGQPVVDPNWHGEMLLDITSAAKRSAILEIETAWIQGCAQKGFDALEVDNLDTYSRSDGRIAEDQAVAMIRALSDVAHAAGLAVAQKNSSEIAGRKAEMGTDFAVSEECNTYHECYVYQSAYGNHVLVIEYEKASFDQGCRAYPELSIVLRDLEVSAQGSANYVYEGC